MSRRRPLLSARAIRLAERLSSSRRYLIDDGEQLRRWRHALVRRAGGLGWPPAATPYKWLPPLFELRDSLLLAHLLLFLPDLDSRTRKKMARATGLVPMEKEQRREQEAVPEQIDARREKMQKKSSRRTRYPRDARSEIIQ